MTLLTLSLSGCASPVPLKIGFLAGLTGSNSELGIGARRAAELLLTQVNREGGVNGSPLELVVLDDGNNPAQGLAACQRFKELGVTAILGPVASTVIGEILPFINANRLPTISPTVSALSVAGKNDFFYRVITVNSQMGDTLALYAMKQQLSDVAVLRETSNTAYTLPIYESFRQRLGEAGQTTRTPIEFDLRESPNYKLLAGRLGSAPAYLLLANGYDSAQVGQALAQMGYLSPILAPPWAMTPDVVGFGGRQVERMVFVSIYDSQSRNPAWMKFRQEYIAVYGEEPGFSAVYAHDALHLLLVALKKAKNYQPNELKLALDSVGPIDGLQSTFQLDANGDVVRELFLLTVRDGRFIRTTP